MALFSSLKKNGFRKTLNDKISSGNILYDFISVVLNGTSKTSLELIRLGEINRVSRKIGKKYKKIIETPLADQSWTGNISDLPVWTMWLQGENNAPEMVATTLRSIKNNYSNVIVIDQNNFRDFITIPQYIVAKWKQGKISDAHFSDIIRTNLLVEYGGTWIDSTTYISKQSSWLNKKIENEPLFFFQNMRPGSMGNSIFLSSWFITARPNEPSLLRLRELLNDYWKRNNHLKDYFLFHIFWHLIFNAHPQVFRKIPKVPNSLPLQLMYELNNQLSENEINEILTNFPIQKLTYKNLSSDLNSTYFKIVNRSL
ncbi:capsular polysaccharide synthesis protein [Lapidilactobacillus wuchangensis]|uniref:capsular polysaccharide synthesis protein n=1 Tax=Lapidilactobacillus wuchangensis TaxID=2486001 RepID=UPI000F7672FC|nr:capsular polysaccharide synthesis protein [Lapidilactobacillus wuchangensis]